MTFTAIFEGSPLSTGRTESLLIMQSIQAASLDYFYKIEVKVAPSLKEHMAVFPTQRKKDHGAVALGRDTRFLDKLQELFKTHQILPSLGHFFMKRKLLRDSLMCCLGLILTKSKLSKTGTISSNEEGSAYMHQIIKKS